MSFFAMGLLLLVLLVAIVGWRRPPVTAHAPERDDEAASSNNQGRAEAVSHLGAYRRTRDGQRSSPPAPVASLPAASLPAAVEARAGAPDQHQTEKARDSYYERLLDMQGHDQAKEDQLQRRLTETFGDDPDTLIGPVACSAEFCRIELRALGEVDVRQRWQDKVSSAVEPRGLRFMVIAKDEEDTTIANCYFGRHDSWRVPDFHALGLI